MTFSDALAALKAGSRIARVGWNGKGMWIALVAGSGWALDDAALPLSGHRLLPWIGMKTADDAFVPWLASQTDILADDWTVIP